MTFCKHPNEGEGDVPRDRAQGVVGMGRSLGVRTRGGDLEAMGEGTKELLLRWKLAVREGEDLGRCWMGGWMGRYCGNVGKG